jgi:hypothetical protein
MSINFFNFIDFESDDKINEQTINESNLEISDELKKAALTIGIDLTKNTSKRIE